MIANIETISKEIGNASEGVVKLKADLIFKAKKLMEINEHIKQGNITK
jgi:hypothetical protein